jgi:hypothetical protein
MILSFYLTGARCPLRPDLQTTAMKCNFFMAYNLIERLPAAAAVSQMFLHTVLECTTSCLRQLFFQTFKKVIIRMTVQYT